MNISSQDSRILSNYENSKHFIHASVQLFRKYRWAYQFKMTEILFPENVEKLPKEFFQFFHTLEIEGFKKLQTLLLDVQVAEQECPTSWPEEITAFIQACTNLKLEEEPYEKLNNKSPSQIPKMWSKKKFEEVSYLSNFVNENIRLTGCDAIVDIGSGLGYLSSHLSDTCGIPVIAVESSQEMVQSSSSLKIKETAAVEYVNLELNECISTQLSPYLSKYSNICITGLHACGNLTPWSLKLFLEDSRYSFLAIVPCCYHKMNQNLYQSIPLSHTLRDELAIFDDGYGLVRNEAFCRIASQRSAKMFAIDLENETKHTFYRGLLELYAREENIEMLINRRKGLKGRLGCFKDYIVKAIGPDGKFIMEGEFESHKENLLRLSIQNNGLLNVVTGIIVMQGALQTIAENLILLDRMVFLLESGKVEASLKRVIPEAVSPRGKIISAKKVA